MKTYIYPQNLKAKPHLWLWGMRDFVILALLVLLSAVLLVHSGLLAPMAVLVLLSAVLLVHSGLLAPMAGALCFAFVTIRMEDTTVMDYLSYALGYFVIRQKHYEWR